MTTTITPTTVSKGTIAYSFISKLIDRFRPKERIKVVWTGPNYSKVVVLWGLFEYEGGEKREFLIEGPQGFCDAVLKELRHNSGSLKVLNRHLIHEN